MSAADFDIGLAEAALCRVATARLGPDIRYMREQSIDLAEAEACAGLLTVNAIRPRSDGGFNFDERGIEGAVIEVLGEDAETITDLVGWPTASPHRWRRWAGTAGALGTAAAVNASTYFGGQPLRIYRTPLRWLQAGGVGFCPLDQKWSIQYLREIAIIAGTLAAEDDLHAAELVASRYALVDEQRVVVPATAARRAAA